MARGEHLRGAGRVAHPVVEAAGAGVAYRGTGDELCGGRSLFVLEFLVRVFGRRIWGWLRVREDTRSTVVRSVAALGDGGHGGDMAGRR